MHSQKIERTSVSFPKQQYF